MTPYRERPDDAPDLPALIDLDPARLDRDAEVRLRERLAVPLAGALHASRQPGRIAALFLLMLALAVAVTLVVEGTGLRAHGHSPPFTALVFGVLASIAVLGLSWFRAPAPPLVGRVLLAEGAVEVGPTLRFAPADRIVAFGAVNRRWGATLEGGDRYPIATSVDPAAVQSVLARGEEIRATRAQGDWRALARLELFSREELAAARVRTGAWRRPGALALATGAVVALVAFGGYLPARELAGRAGWRCPLAVAQDVAVSYPLPWVHARAHAILDGERARRREALLARAVPERRAALGDLLDWTWSRDLDLVGVRLVTPEDLDDVYRLSFPDVLVSLDDGFDSEIISVVDAARAPDAAVLTISLVPSSPGVVAATLTLSTPGREDVPMGAFEVSLPAVAGPGNKSSMLYETSRAVRKGVLGALFLHAGPIRNIYCRLTRL